LACISKISSVAAEMGASIQIVPVDDENG